MKITGTAAQILGQPLAMPAGGEIKNRFMKSAMSEVLAGPAGRPSEGLSRLYETWARGGVGLLVTGNVMIDGRALGEPNNVVVEDERHMDELRAWARAGTSDGTHLWMQLNHPGKQSPRFLSKNPVAPSAVPPGKELKAVFNTPRELSDDEIWDLIRRFACTAAIAKKAGFTGVQIHGAHGYLVSQFLSAHHNRRSDSWGGTAPKRMRFVLEVYRAIRQQVGAEFPVSIKLNSADFQRGGFTEEESLAVVEALADAGIDLVEISGGNYESPAMIAGDGISKRTAEREAFFLSYAEQARKLVDLPLVVTGGFRTARGMADAISSGAVDMVGLARPFALEPDFPRRILQGEDFTSIVRPPSTGIPRVDQLSMLALSWYENQLARMAKGRAPNPKMGAWSSVFRTAFHMGLGAFRKRRA